MDYKNMDLKEWQNALVNDEFFGSSFVAEAPASYNPRYKDNAIVTLTFEFALSIWDLSEELQEQKKISLNYLN